MYVTSRPNHITRTVLLLYCLVSTTSLHAVLCESTSPGESVGYDTGEQLFNQPQTKTTCDEGNCNNDSQELNIPIALASQKEQSPQLSAGADDKSKANISAGSAKDGNGKSERSNSETAGKLSTNKLGAIPSTKSPTTLRNEKPAPPMRSSPDPRR